MGIYNQLMEHDDPRLKPLQRHVGYFRIIVLGKRKEHALAADEAARWLQANPAANIRRSREGLGVQLELAKNILAQLPEITRPSDREAAIRRATDVLGEVVRYPSPYKAEALGAAEGPQAAGRRQRRGRGEAELRGGDRAGRPGDGRARMGPRHRPAPGRGPPRRPGPGPRQGQPRPLQHGLLLLHGQALLRGGRPRRAPGPALSQGGLSAKATEIGMAALADAYNHVRRGRPLGRPEPPDRPGLVHGRDLARLRARRTRRG